MPLRTDTARRPVEQRLFTPWRCEQAPSGSTARTTCGGTTRATRASLSTFAPRTTPRACAQSRRPSGLRGGAGRTTAQRCASSSRQPASKVGPLSPRPSDWRQETWLRSAQGLGNARSLRHTVTPPPPPHPHQRCAAWRRTTSEPARSPSFARPARSSRRTRTRAIRLCSTGSSPPRGAYSPAPATRPSPSSRVRRRTESLGLCCDRVRGRAGATWSYEKCPTKKGGDDIRNDIKNFWGIYVNPREVL